MSVIVTGMDMPTACKDCEYPNCDYYKAEWCRHGDNSINYMTAKSDDCTLKSIDGLIEKIEQRKSSFLETGNWLEAGECMNLIHIIKEYCEVKE